MSDIALDILKYSIICLMRIDDHGLAAPMELGSTAPARQCGARPAPAPSAPSQPSHEVHPVSNSDGRESSSRAARRTLDTPTDLDDKAVARDFRRAERAPGRHLRALSQDQEFPLARQRAAFPRLPPAARRAGRAASRTASTSWPSASARSAARRSARSATSPSCSASTTTTRPSSRPGDMLRELMNDNKAHDREHAQGAQASPTTTRTWRPRACSRVFIDEAEKRCWFLFEASRGAEQSGH